MTSASDDRALRQRAGAEVERMMIEFMIQFQPCEKLLVADVIQIAAQARRLAFDIFSEELP